MAENSLIPAAVGKKREPGFWKSPGLNNPGSWKEVKANWAPTQQLGLNSAVALLLTQTFWNELAQEKQLYMKEWVIKGNQSPRFCAKIIRKRKAGRAKMAQQPLPWEENTKKEVNAWGSSGNTKGSDQQSSGKINKTKAKPKRRRKRHCWTH